MTKMRTIAVASNKGGTGKSTLAANLGLALVSLGHRVAFMDCDVEGPNLHRALGLDEAPYDVDAEKQGFIPYHGPGWELFTIAPLWGDKAAVLWRDEDVVVEVSGESERMKGTGKWSLIRQLSRGILWSEADFMICDLPPTSGALVQSLFQSLDIWGTVLVCQPTPLAVDDVKRSVNMLSHLHIPLIGLVENMAYFLAPDTGKRYPIFVSGSADVRGFCKAEGVPHLGEVPLCPDLETLKPIYRAIAGEIIESKPVKLWQLGMLEQIKRRVYFAVAAKMFGEVR